VCHLRVVLCEEAPGSTWWHWFSVVLCVISIFRCSPCCIFSCSIASKKVGRDGSAVSRHGFSAVAARGGFATVFWRDNLTARTKAGVKTGYGRNTWRIHCTQWRREGSGREQVQQEDEIHEKEYSAGVSVRLSKDRSGDRGILEDTEGAEDELEHLG